jgi:hypothetical protein
LGREASITSREGNKRSTAVFRFIFDKAISD